MSVRLGRARTIVAGLLLVAVAAGGILAGLTHPAADAVGSHDRDCLTCHWMRAFVGTAAAPSAPAAAIPLEPQSTTEISDSAVASQHAPAPRSSRAPPLS
jgi:hypothetical protein